MGFVAVIGVLDAHDPRAVLGLSVEQSLGSESPPPPGHHHILVQLEGRAEILSTGLLVGVGEPQDLLAAHTTYSQSQDEAYRTRLRQLHSIIELGSNHGLYYVSDQEPLSATPEGQVYLNAEGGLLR